MATQKVIPRASFRDTAFVIFLASYFVFALGKFPGLKIDRPGAAIIGAVLMVAFRIMSAQEALRAIDFSTIVLLFSMMPIVANLDFVLRVVGTDEHMELSKTSLRFSKFPDSSITFGLSKIQSACVSFGCDEHTPS